jgi:hypothetical protein
MVDFFNNDNLLFHYTKTQIAIERILHKKEFKLSRMDLMNDPKESLDFSLVIANTDTPDLTDEDERNMHFKEIGKISDEFRGAVKRRKIASFCCHTPIVGNMFSYGCCNPRMWSQYADAHQGICLVFSRKELDMIFDSIEHEYYADAVKYDNDKLKNMDVQILDAKKDTRQHIDKFKSYLFLLKANDFQDEKEYRYIVDDNNINSEALTINYKDSLKAIVTSYRFPTAVELNVKNYCKTNGILWYRVNWFLGMPSLKMMYRGE